MIPKLFIPQRSLICHMSNLFRHTCDFPVQWKASYYLKRPLKGTKLPTYKQDSMSLQGGGGVHIMKQHLVGVKGILDDVNQFLFMLDFK